MWFKFLSPYISIFWTKRYVNYKPSSIRTKIQRLKFKHRNTKRIPSFLKIDILKAKRNPYNPLKPQRRNYNNFYRRMELPL